MIKALRWMSSAKGFFVLLYQAYTVYKSSKTQRAKRKVSFTQASKSVQKAFKAKWQPADTCKATRKLTSKEP